MDVANIAGMCLSFQAFPIFHLFIIFHLLLHLDAPLSPSLTHCFLFDEFIIIIIHNSTHFSAVSCSHISFHPVDLFSYCLPFFLRSISHFISTFNHVHIAILFIFVPSYISLFIRHPRIGGIRGSYATPPTLCTHTPIWVGGAALPTPPH